MHRTVICWLSLGTRGTVTAMLLRVPCSTYKRMGPIPCAPAQGLMAPSPSPWQCFSEAGSSTFPSGGWMADATMPWAGKAGTMRSSSPPWRPWSSTSCGTLCPLWTDTAAAGNSPACSSPPSLEATAKYTLPLAPVCFLSRPTLGCLPLSFPTPPHPSLSQCPQAALMGKGCLEAQGRVLETPPHAHLEPPTALSVASPRLTPSSWPPGMQVSAQFTRSWMKEPWWPRPVRGQHRHCRNSKGSSHIYLWA
nr:SH2 domain-containing protein 6 isoform X2 [Gorilla gorilla gorilla]